MPDGHLNKCKRCTKIDSKINYFSKKEDKNWYSKELERQRIKGKNSNKNKKYTDKYPEKREAASISRKMVPPKSGLHKHHWSYNVAHYKDVIWLSEENHSTIHRFIIYDQERRMYRRIDNNELLDSKLEHEKFILLKLSEANVSK